MRAAGSSTRQPPHASPHTNWPPWVVFHVPHASTVVPGHARAAIILDDDELAIELGRLTDHGTDVLFVPPGAQCPVIAAEVSRFVVDVERFLDDKREPMAKVGMGAIYTRATDGRPLRRPLTKDEEHQLLTRYYHPHHQRLTEAVDHVLANHGRALILDLHSFPDEPLPCDVDQNPERPDVCIGSDTLHTPRRLVEVLAKHLTDTGYSVEIDRPYSGAIVPARHYGQDLRVESVMIEINRRLYLEPDSHRLAQTAHHTGARIQACLNQAVAQWASSHDG